MDTRTDAVANTQTFTKRIQIIQNQSVLPEEGYPWVESLSQLGSYAFLSAGNIKLLSSSTSLLLFIIMQGCATSIADIILVCEIWNMWDAYINGIEKKSDTPFLGRHLLYILLSASSSIFIYMGIILIAIDYSPKKDSFNATQANNPADTYGPMTLAGLGFTIFGGALRKLVTRKTMQKQNQNMELVDVNDIGMKQITHEAEHEVAKNTI